MKVRRCRQVYKARAVPAPKDWPKEFAMVRNGTEEADKWAPFSISVPWAEADTLREMPRNLVTSGQFKMEDICWLHGSISLAVGVRRSAVRKGAA